MGKRVWKYRLCDIAAVCGCSRFTVWRAVKAGELVPSDLRSVAAYIMKRTVQSGLRGVDSSGVSVADILASLARIEARIGVEAPLAAWEGTHRAMPHNEVSGVDVEAVESAPAVHLEPVCDAVGEETVVSGSERAQELLARFKAGGMNVDVASSFSGVPAEMESGVEGG